MLETSALEKRYRELICERIDALKWIQEDLGFIHSVKEQEKLIADLQERVTALESLSYCHKEKEK